MSDVDVATETVYRQSDEDDDEGDDGGIDRSIPEARKERALLIQRVLLTEQQWFQSLEVIRTFAKLEDILRQICKKMNLSAKVDSSVKLGAENPATEKFSLVQRVGAEVLKCSVVLHGESIIQTEVIMKYLKMPGGVYRGAAQPDVQWKLQQLQDADNYYVQALNILVRELKWIKQMSPDDIGKMSSTVITTLAKIKSLVGQARSTLCIPEKHTLLELCNSTITRCFNPPLPPDLVFSYYIIENRLVCAAYQATSKTGGTQGLTVTLADCLLPKLVDVLFLADRALSITQQLSYNVSVLEERINTYSHICS
ncbi:unnamed protein product [Litomosoides sigmodontis]|uniref:Uncharacterized protein n=1 Tax=Litomosoides sigmodontis TaxID=42156 RepID=A0A3P6U0A7_LITSI|nr:unnamed protein product [Litomosoides sigmodontis]